MAAAKLLMSSLRTRSQLISDHFKRYAERYALYAMAALKLTILRWLFAVPEGCTEADDIQRAAPYTEFTAA
eukprot:578677-Karenia_brevis.AAC.1